MRRDPTLATAASFLSLVCDGIRMSKDTPDKHKEREMQKSAIAKSIPSDVAKPLISAEVIEKQRITRILVAKTMLGEELAKDKPSMASLDVLRKAAFGTETIEDEEASVTTIVETTVRKCPEQKRVEPPPRALPQTTAVENLIDPVLVTDEHSEVEVSDDAAMSIGDSDNEEEISDDYSRTGSSSCGESTTSRGSRKRPADELPERDPKKTDRREFPGAVTRSEGGCRIYVPPTVIRDTTATETSAATSPETASASAVERANATAVTTDATPATPNATAVTTDATSANPNATVVILNAMENRNATEVSPMTTTENLDATERTFRVGIMIETRPVIVATEFAELIPTIPRAIAGRTDHTNVWRGDRDGRATSVGRRSNSTRDRGVGTRRPDGGGHLPNYGGHGASMDNAEYHGCGRVAISSSG